MSHGRITTIQALTLILVLALGLRAFSFSVTGLDWDESLYVVMAQRWLAGGLPYVAVWDQHPVGVPAVFAAAAWLIGDGLLAARVAGMVAVVGTAAVLVRFLGRTAHNPAAGLLAGVFYLFYMGRPEGLAANAEIFDNFVVAAGSYLLLGEVLREGSPARGRIVFAAGLLFGMGLQLKYVVFPEATGLCCLFLLLVWRKAPPPGHVVRLAALAVMGGLLPTAAVSAYFWHAGALEAYLDANIRANVEYLDLPITADTILVRLRYGLLPIVGLLPCVMAVPWLVGARRGFRIVVVWLMVWLAAAAIDVVLPMKFWKHYFNALVPPLCLIAGLVVMWIAQIAGRRRWLSLGLLITLVLIPAIGQLVKHLDDSRSINRMNVPLAIADRIKQDKVCQHDLYVLNYDPLVYAYANAAPPTRYVLGIELSEFSGTSGALPAEEIPRILSTQPCWIVVADPSPYAFTPHVWEMVNATLRGYRVAQTYSEDDYIQPPITVRLYRRASEGRL